MSREHGTRARYVWGPDEDGVAGRPCRCPACSLANSAYNAHRERMKAYGREPYVDAEQARQHVRMLSAYGIGWRRAAELAGVSQGSMGKLLRGGPGGSPASRRIRPGTEARILAVRPSPDLLGAAALVDATGTRRRLQALIAAGWSKQKLASRLGAGPQNFGAMMERPQVTAATARAVTALYGELQYTLPPHEDYRDKSAWNRARGYAAARNWPPPGAWDDDIDDPAARPHWNWVRPELRPLQGTGLGEAA